MHRWKPNPVGHLQNLFLALKVLNKSTNKTRNAKCKRRFCLSQGESAHSPLCPLKVKERSCFSLCSRGFFLLFNRNRTTKKSDMTEPLCNTHFSSLSLWQPWPSCGRMDFCCYLKLCSPAVSCKNPFSQIQLLLHIKDSSRAVKTPGLKFARDWRLIEGIHKCSGNTFIPSFYLLPFVWL